MKPLIVPGTSGSVEQIILYVLQVAAHCGLDYRRTYKLRLAVDEVATNIVQHGYIEADRSGEIKVWAEIKSDHVCIFLEDTGAAYNPYRSLCEEWRTQPPEERPLEGGMGLFLALNSIDQFHYQYNAEMNRSILVMKRR